MKLLKYISKQGWAIAKVGNLNIYLSYPSKSKWLSKRKLASLLFLSMVCSLSAQAHTATHSASASQVEVSSSAAVHSINITELVSRTNDFLSTLSSVEKGILMYPIDSEQRHIWSNFNESSSRKGLKLGNLSKSQLDTLFTLLENALSNQGVETVSSIMKLNAVLGFIKEQNARFSEDNYYLILFGTPSKLEPWGFQMEGHHLALNYYVDKDQVVMSPAFWGSEPVSTPNSLNVQPRFHGLKVFEQERAFASSIVASLNESQQEQAHLSYWSGSIKTGAGNDSAKLPLEGLVWGKMNQTQQFQLWQIIKHFVKHLREDQAKIDLKDIERKIDQTYFSYREHRQGRLYVRVVNPYLTIELDELSGTYTDEEHVHVMVRYPDGRDYGENFLVRHLKSKH